MMEMMTISYRCKFVTVDKVEHFPVESSICPQIEIFPVPVVSLIILGQSLTLDQFTCEYQVKSFL